MRRARFSSCAFLQIALLVLAVLAGPPNLLAQGAADGASPQEAAAQQAGDLEPLTPEDYDRWRAVTSVALSDDGRWMTYGYRGRVGADTLHVADLDGGDGFTVPLGANPVFSDDSRWVAYRIVPEREGSGGGGRGGGGRGGRGGGGGSGQAVELMELATGDRVRWENVTSFQFNEGSTHLAVKKRAAGGGSGGSAGGGGDDVPAGTPLLLRDLARRTELLLGGVDDFAFNDPGTLLAWTVDAPDRSGNGLYVLDLADGVTRPLDNDSLRYARMTWDEGGTALAVLKGDTPEGMTERDNALVAFRDVHAPEPRRFDFDPRSSGALPEGMVLSDRAGLTWRQDFSQIFVGIKEQAEEVEEDPDSPPSSVMVFHWKDERIQTVQRNRANQDRNFTWQGAVSVPSGRFVRLTDESMRSLQLTDDGRWGVGQDGRAYVSDWEERRADYWRVDPATGERTPMLTEQGRTLGLSPDGRYFVYWRDGDIHVYDLDRGESRNLTASAPVSFVNEEYDHPGTKPPYGVAGWTADGDALVLNHRYDLWLQPLDGSPATNLTGGRGDAEEVRFRWERVDREEEAMDLSGPVLLSAYGEWTKQSGWFELEDGRLRELVFGDRQYDNLAVARGGDRAIFTWSTFADFPDYWAADRDLSEPVRITDANPQQAEYAWGHRILFDFENSQGVRLQGTLAIPDGYEAGERLPMIVLYYEKKSQDMHSYYAPIYGSSYPAGNPGPVAELAAYVSNGYLVMQPDVHFNTGTTHSDMLDCVEAATRKVVEMGYADPERIALGGGSFSGGGSAFIATQSDMFAAIVSRAAPINLAGEFNIVFPGSGQNNHSYDIYGQGRYGTNPFDDFELYREQSPITHVESMNTPLLYLHGEQDGSVEYLQGMEFYNALRFLGKPIIFLSYPDEGHNLTRYENQVDFVGRLWQFLDHYLKDAPAPDWMVNGLPYLERGR